MEGRKKRGGKGNVAQQRQFFLQGRWSEKKKDEGSMSTEGGKKREERRGDEGKGDVSLRDEQTVHAS